METAASLPCSQKPVICPCLEPNKFSLRPGTIFQFHSGSTLPVQFFQSLSFLLDFQPKRYIYFHLPLSVLQGHSSYSLWSDRLNDIWQGVQIMTFLIKNLLRLRILFSFSASNALFIIKFAHTKLVFSPWCERPRQTTKTYSVTYFNHEVSGQ
jgi:hypothetical protein